MKTLILSLALLLGTSLNFACGGSGGGGNDGGNDGTAGDASGDAGGDDGGDGGSIDPESAAGLELVGLYAGTYNVEAAKGFSHSRGTVTIAAGGSSIDFDTGLVLNVSGENVFNRIPNFPEEPRVQIEFPGSPQERIRIYVNPDDKLEVLRFTYDDDANDETQAIDVNVVP